MRARVEKGDVLVRTKFSCQSQCAYKNMVFQMQDKTWLGDQ